MKSFNSIPLLASVIFLLLTACGSPASEKTEPETITKVYTEYMPEEFVAVLDAHGGLANWKELSQLSYKTPSGDGFETHIVDLHSRRKYIKQPAADGGDPVEMGFDGENVWITADTTYSGDPIFYKNLMSYFYIMPWILADPAIVYSEAEPLTFNGTSYPGILLGFKDGVGNSPKDNYRFHYDPATKKMRWLGYTVTGHSGEANEEFSWIEYPTWSDHDGVQLADSLVWYVTEENLPVEPRNTRLFTEVELSKQVVDSVKFARPEGARVVSE